MKVCDHYLRVQGKKERMVATPPSVTQPKLAPYPVGHRKGLVTLEPPAECCTRAQHQPKVHTIAVHGWHSSQIVRMILPQVHLRKPCYDFSFL